VAQPVRFPGFRQGFAAQPPTDVHCPSKKLFIALYLQKKFKNS
jgi:hypothetical protein